MVSNQQYSRVAYSTLLRGRPDQVDAAGRAILHALRFGGQGSAVYRRQALTNGFTGSRYQVMMRRPELLPLPANVGLALECWMLEEVCCELVTCVLVVSSVVVVVAHRGEP